MHIQALETAGTLVQPPTSERLKSGCVILRQGEAVGEHRTDGREEILIFLQGKAQVECEGESAEVDENSIVYIPRDARHNVINKSARDLKYIYVVTPDT